MKNILRNRKYGLLNSFSIGKFGLEGSCGDIGRNTDERFIEGDMVCQSDMHYRKVYMRRGHKGDHGLEETLVCQDNNPNPSTSNDPSADDFEHNIRGDIDTGQEVVQTNGKQDNPYSIARYVSYFKVSK